MDTNHRFWIMNGTELFLTASTIEWARLKVAAFAFDQSLSLHIEDRETTERLEERGVRVE